MNTTTRGWSFRALTALLTLALTSALLAVTAQPAAASPNQLMFVDEDLLHNFNQYAQIPIGNLTTPANDDWVAPINYRNGRAYFRLEVTSKPSNIDARAQLCLWRDDPSTPGNTSPFETETCAGQLPFSTTGVFWLDLGKPLNWWKLNGVWDWTLPIDRARIMIKDAASGNLLMAPGGGCGSSCYQGSDIMSHVPIEFNAQIVLVDQGASLTAPAEWVGGCPASWSSTCVANDFDITNVAVSNVGSRSAVVTYDTSEAADSQVDYGVGSPNGMTATGGTNTTTHSATLYYLDCNTTYEAEPSASNNNGTSVGSTVTFTTDPCGSIFSDDFASGLDVRWDYVDPVGGATLTLPGYTADIAIPANNEHNLWVNENDAARLRQPGPSGNFEVEAKFESVLNARYQIQGIVVEEDDDSFIRLGVHHDGTTPRLFAAKVINGSSTTLYNQPVAVQSDYILRAGRVGNVWTYSYFEDSSQTWQQIVTFTQALESRHLGPYIGTAESNGTSPAFTGVIDYFFDTANPIIPEDGGAGVDTTGPTIIHFHGTNVSFGSPGLTQPEANVLGRVEDASGIFSLTYRLNGGAAIPLSLGDDLRRLALPGDFNVDLDAAGLNVGANTVELTATDNVGNITTETVTVNWAPGNTWPNVYTADWDSAAALHDIAQPIDGRWFVQGSELRLSEAGYDRLIAVGDSTLTSFTAQVPITVNSVDFATGNRSPSNGPGIGLLTHWQGHSSTATQPNYGFLNQFGGILWYRYKNTPHSLRIIDHANQTAANDTSGFTLVDGVTYIFKIEVDVTGAAPLYSFKVWEQGQTEPANWTITATMPTGGPTSGALALVAHHVDVTFGNLEIFPLGGGGPVCNGLYVTVDLNLGQSPTAFDDVILGTPGDDVINAGAGDDTVCAGDGDDTVYGLDGNDTLFGEAGADTLLGFAGDDELRGSTGDDVLNGGPGNDVLLGHAGNDSLYGQDGNDTLDGSFNLDTLIGGNGNDTLIGGGGVDVLNGGPGVDDIDGGAANDAIYGGPDGDTIDGGADDDTIYGQAGDDVIDGGTGDDNVWGNEGNDTIVTADGDNLLNGGPGNDTITGGSGPDTIYGDGDISHAGDDVLDGGAGVDNIFGFAGDDTVTSTDGEADVVNAGPHTAGDSCTFDLGVDTVYNCP